MSDERCSSEGFCGIGRWRGTAEVYGGDGRFLANASDDRHVRTVLTPPAGPEGDAAAPRVRIDLAFVGPFKMAGHYVIEEQPDRRLYLGPANIGHGEPLGRNVVDANAYWPAVGLSQRFFLMVLPDGDHQLSLAHLRRGEQLLYVVVGDHQRIAGDNPGEIPGLVAGTAHDLAADPTAGRGEILAHRSGEWTGELTVLVPEQAATSGGRDQLPGAARLVPAGGTVLRERVRADASGRTAVVEFEGGGFGERPARAMLRTDGWTAWTTGGDLAGSYGLSGGRAISGDLHHPARGTRVWRREVIRHDGALKAVVHVWYQGGHRVAVQHGVLRFAPT